MRGAFVIAQEHLDLQLSEGVTLGAIACSVGAPSEAAKSYDATLALLARAWLRLPADTRVRD